MHLSECSVMRNFSDRRLLTLSSLKHLKLLFQHVGT